MKNYTIKDRVLFIKIFYQNQSSITKTMRKLQQILGPKNVPTKATIYRIMKQFEETGTVADRPKPGPCLTTRTSETIHAVQASVSECSSTSIRHRSQEFGISPSSLWHILHKDLQLFPYKIQLTQQILPQDHLRRRTYANRIISFIMNEPDFHKNLLMSDEAHFHLQGHVNKQNSRFWAKENLQIICELPLHSAKVTVWCAIWSGGIIGPYFFEDEKGNAVTVTGDRYRHMLEHFLIPKLDALGLVNMWFQQDGATSHTAKATMKLLFQMFPEKIISKNGNVEWPPRSPDLTAPDFFLWGYLKSKVYANKPETLKQLKENIREEISNISRDLCENVLKNVIQRARICEANRGGHLSDILFHV